MLLAARRRARRLQGQIRSDLARSGHVQLYHLAYQTLSETDAGRATD